MVIRCLLNFCWLSIVLLCCADAALFLNNSLLVVPGMDVMTSDKFPHIGIIERVSRTKLFMHRHRRQVIAGPIYEWETYEIPYTIWGGDCKFISFLS
uniref:Secreted protein n=1 Tax=Syphacia muris TaxID=451379 RepID=A0A0N5AQ28_9BILA